MRKSLLIIFLIAVVFSACTQEQDVFRSVLQHSQTERNKYQFIASRLFPAYDSKESAMVRSGIAFCIAFCCAYGVLQGVAYSNLAEVFSMPLMLKLATQVVTDMIRDNVWIAFGLALIGGTMMYGLVRDGMSVIAPTHSKQETHEALIHIVKHWPHYRMCVPTALERQFELLFLMFHANGQKLPVKDIGIDLIVDAIALQCSSVLSGSSNQKNLG